MQLMNILNISQKFAFNVIYIYFQEYLCSLCCIVLTRTSGSVLIKLVILAGPTLKPFWGNGIQTPVHVFNYNLPQKGCPIWCAYFGHHFTSRITSDFMGKSAGETS